jgi:hypothetical protein
MDGEKFDDLLKRFCTTRLTRLDALRGLVAGAAAALTGASIGSDDAEAKNKKKGAAKQGGVKAQGKKKKKGKPSTPGGNVTCAGGLKVDSGQFQAGKCGNVKHSSSDCECTIRWCVSADGKTLSFGPAEGEVPCLVGKVIVKGGPASEVYEFDPPVTSADGLVSPDLDNGNTPEISHFTFCDIECPPCDPDDCPERPCKEAFCDDQGKCAYRPVVCPEPDNKCEEAFCDPDKGCKTRPIVCPPSDNKCEEVYCDPEKGCKTRPIVCDDGDLCTTDRCNPKTGECEYNPVVCEPADACETCVCKSKTGECECTPVDCDDDDPCTIDRCDPEKGCKHDPVICEPENKCQKNCVCVPKKDGTHKCECEPVVCDDGDLCTTDRCNPDTGQCEYTPVVCDDEDLCTTDRCNPKTGECEFSEIICDPETLCETCICKAKTGECECEPVVCDDDNACTVDSCDPEKGCKHDPVDCDDDIVCTVDTCDPASGCAHRPDNSLCPPRSGCTAVCDPENGDANGCVYTCICIGDESPKGCPNEGDQPQYTCKRCPGGNNGGSVQVECSGSTPRCVCNSKDCTIGTTTVPRDTDVTSVCPPVQCNTGRPV